MTYDNWKTQTPPYYDYEEGATCGFCGEEIPNGESYCDKNCQRADVSENT